MPRCFAIFEAVLSFMSAPARNRVIVGCGTPVALAMAFADSPLDQIAFRNALDISSLMQQV